jgi:uncharacterized membrane protein YfcA
MLNFETFDLSVWQWLLLAVVAVFVGVAKTGIPGFGVLVVSLAAMNLPAKTSIGVVLPMLIFADIFAIIYYRRHADFKHIFRLLPATLAGIGIGYFLIDRIRNEQLKPMIGAIVLVMLAIYFVRQLRNNSQTDDVEQKKPHMLLAPVLGLFAGFTTMLANAAGPVTTIYFLMMSLPKKRFVGTAAWFFFIVNWVKVPLYVEKEFITIDSLKLNASLAGFIVIGIILGIFALKKIPQKAFNIIVQTLAAVAAIKLLLS